MAKEKKKTPKQMAKELEVLERGNRVVNLRKSGASFRAIAVKLAEEGIAEVTYQTVRRDYLEAMRILAEHRLEETAELKEMQNQRLEEQLLAHWVPSTGKTYIETDPTTREPVIDPATKKPKKIHIPPDAEHGRLVLGIIKEISELNCLKVQKHEIEANLRSTVIRLPAKMTPEEWLKQSQK